jgi:hypothetical protein
MNPPQFHIEHSRLHAAELERDAARRHKPASDRRRRLRNPFARR